MMTVWPARASTSPVNSGTESATWRPVRCEPADHRRGTPAPAAVQLDLPGPRHLVATRVACGGQHGLEDREGHGASIGHWPTLGSSTVMSTLSAHTATVDFHRHATLVV